MDRNWIEIVYFFNKFLPENVLCLENYPNKFSVKMDDLGSEG